jgi:hypothetical protein
MASSLTPEWNRMICVRHRLLSICKYRTWSSPVQIKNYIHSLIEDPLNKASDSIYIILSTIFRLNPVDTKPTLFIQWNPYSISIPILHVLNHIVIVGAIKYSISIYTLELCSRVRETLQDNLSASGIIY